MKKETCPPRASLLAAADEGVRRNARGGRGPQFLKRHGGTELGKNGINRKERRDPIERRGGSSAMHGQDLDEAHGEGFGGGEGWIFAGEAGVGPFPAMVRRLIKIS
jgi:hypothetical protein